MLFDLFCVWRCVLPWPRMTGRSKRPRELEKCQARYYFYDECYAQARTQTWYTFKHVDIHANMNVCPSIFIFMYQFISTSFYLCVCLGICLYVRVYVLIYVFILVLYFCFVLEQNKWINLWYLIHLFTPTETRIQTAKETLFLQHLPLSTDL